MSRRVTIQRASLVVAVMAGLAAIVIADTGGLSISPFGLRITARDPFRALYASALAVVVFALAGGSFQGVLPTGRWAAGAAVLLARRLLRLVPPAWVLSLILALATTAVAWVWGTKAVGGADSYGYLSQAELWTKGLPRIEQSFVREVPWPNAIASFTPLGYRPLADFQDGGTRDSSTLVPIYASGLPLILAGAKLIGGTQAMFFVVPLLAGLLVLLTFAIGRRLASPAAGLVGAWLVATSPAVLFMMITTMTDVPVASVWALAIWCVLRDTPPSAAAAGLASGVAVLIRPNHVVLAPAIALYYAMGLLQSTTRRASLRAGVVYVAGLLPGIAGVALLNHALYGSPTMSGYGDLDSLFGLENVRRNIALYVGWLIETQTIVPVIGMVALLMPFRSLWSMATPRAVITMAVFAGSVWGLYLAYVPWDAWWYLRFLLAAWPMMMIGVGAVAVALVGWRPAVMRPVVVVGLLCLGLFQLRVADARDVFGLWRGERRFVVGADMTSRLTDPNSVVIAGQHSGTVRFYGSRMTMHYDAIDRRWVDRTIAWFVDHGVHPYLLIEPWEMPYVQKRFSGQRAAAILDTPPLATYREPGTLYLFDLAPVAGASVHRQVVTGTYDDLWAAEKAPEPRLVFKK